METPDELLDQVARCRDRQFAELFVFQLHLAFEVAPDLVRSALEKVFDLSAVKTVADRADHAAREALAEAQRISVDVRVLIEEVNKTLELAEYRMEQLIEKGRLIAKGIERLEARVNGQTKGATAR